MQKLRNYVKVMNKRNNAPKIEISKFSRNWQIFEIFNLLVIHDIFHHT